MPSYTPRLPFRKTRVGRLIEHVRTKWLKCRRWAHQFACAPHPGQTRILLIVGCQRSGTKLMLRVFERDLNTTVLWEDSCITGKKEQRFRLLPYRDVNQILAMFRTALIVTKPLEESHNTREMLENIPGSKALWMYRDYRDVARSKVRKSPDQMRHITQALEGDKHGSLSGKLSEQTRSILFALSHQHISQHDAAAMYWYARNVLFFQLGLDAHPDVLLCKYEDFAAHPEKVMSNIYRFACVTRPQRINTREVDPAFVGPGCHITFHKQVNALCSDLLRRLDERYASLGNAAGWAIGHAKPTESRQVLHLRVGRGCPR